MTERETLGREIVKEARHFKGRDQEYTTISKELWDRVSGFLLTGDRAGDNDS